MGLFRQKHSAAAAPSPNPLITYTIAQNLAGKLTVTSPVPTAYAYSITLSLKKSFRDTIEVAIHRSIASTYEQHADVVGHCLIQTASAKFLDCKFDAYGTDVKLEKSGGGLNVEKTTYKLEVPRLGKYKWVHDHEALTSADKRLKLVEESSGAVLARFGGAQGVNEFGVLEVYDWRVAQDQDWCGLCVLTAVCVYAREERTRERKKKANGIVSAVGNWGGLLTMGMPVGN
ncbi:hypothetical protein BU26DRAFT_518481 [Trematosphaeria pertusa]|uniref:Uncharacterized protein n=1 Tax=Trematosphaeria pertusa TaxID=390896 RepID=A0A6A6IKK1_9PLEO|nr:uncharacterized protein BU26DRAFT_518481 [Trematosphaeria pertusa]KAF2250013.1 hypothetical protein BU26DRAFT_518481 [Trematosphaeria pertusa]